MSVAIRFLVILSSCLIGVLISFPRSWTRLIVVFALPSDRVVRHGQDGRGAVVLLMAIHWPFRVARFDLQNQAIVLARRATTHDLPWIADHRNFTLMILQIFQRWCENAEIAFEPPFSCRPPDESRGQIRP